MLILNGKKLNQEIASELREAISAFGEAPQLLIIQIGENKASEIYIQKKIDFGHKIGAIVTIKYFSNNVEENEVINFIEQANSRENVDGIIVQLPIPKQLNKQKIIETISKQKDVDGLNDSEFVPATTKGVLTILQKNNLNVKDKKVVIINDSDLIGKPTAKEIKKKGGKVIVCNENTENLAKVSKSSDILITAIGQPEIIDEKYLKNDQVVIDIGISKTVDGIKGDVKRELIDENGKEIKLLARTPVPGGVGPMTVASLFQNLVVAFQNQHNQN